MKELIKKILKPSFLRYVVVGNTSFLIEYGLFYILYQFLKIQALYANANSVFIAFWYNFLLNRRWSFGSKEPIFRQLVLYLALMFFNMGFSSAFIHLTDLHLNLDPKIAKIIAMSITVAWNYLIYKKLIFKNKKK